MDEVDLAIQIGPISHCLQEQMMRFYDLPQAQDLCPSKDASL